MTRLPHPVSRRRPAAQARRAAGFTLVEVMIAMVIMAVLAGMAWRGVDSLMRLKAGAQATTDRTLKLTAGMSQFEYDLSMLTDTGAMSSLSFDGANLRVTRRHPDGVQLVMWTLQDNQWQRWASPPVTHVADLQDYWLRSQQWTAVQPQAVPVLQQVTQFQVYLYRGNGWSNAQSSNDVTQVPANGGAVVPPATAASGGAPVGGTPASGTPKSGFPVGDGDGGNLGVADIGGGTTVASIGAQQQQRTRTIQVAPTGIRIVLTLPGGDITREKILPPAGAQAAGAS